MDKMRVINFSEFDLMQIGNGLEIAGVLYANGANNYLITLPGEGYIVPDSILIPDSVQWVKIIRQSDLKETLASDQKTILRKSSRQIDQRIAWEVYRRDNFTCRYCGDDKNPMTVDHVVTWEEGGMTVPMNLICSCKKCNNKRGNMDYMEWLESPYYLSKVPQLTVDVITANSRVVTDIPYIKEHYLQSRKKSR